MSKNLKPHPSGRGYQSQYVTGPVDSAGYALRKEPMRPTSKKPIQLASSPDWIPPWIPPGCPRAVIVPSRAMKNSVPNRTKTSTQLKVREVKSSAKNTGSKTPAAHEQQKPQLKAPVTPYQSRLPVTAPARKKVADSEISRGSSSSRTLSSTRSNMPKIGRNEPAAQAKKDGNTVFERVQTIEALETVPVSQKQDGKGSKQAGQSIGRLASNRLYQDASRAKNQATPAIQKWCASSASNVRQYFQKGKEPVAERGAKSQHREVVSKNTKPTLTASAQRTPSYERIPKSKESTKPSAGRQTEIKTAAEIYEECKPDGSRFPPFPQGHTGTSPTKVMKANNQSVGRTPPIAKKGESYIPVLAAAKTPQSSVGKTPPIAKKGGSYIPVLASAKTPQSSVGKTPPIAKKGESYIPVLASAKTPQSSVGRTPPIAKKGESYIPVLASAKTLRSKVLSQQPKPDERSVPKQEVIAPAASNPTRSAATEGYWSGRYSTTRDIIRQEIMENQNKFSFGALDDDNPQFQHVVFNRLANSVKKQYEGNPDLCRNQLKDLGIYQDLSYRLLMFKIRRNDKGKNSDEE